MNMMILFVIVTCQCMCYVFAGEASMSTYEMYADLKKLYNQQQCTLEVKDPTLPFRGLNILADDGVISLGLKEDVKLIRDGDKSLKISANTVTFTGALKSTTTDALLKRIESLVESTTTDALLKRIESLEKDNTALKAQVTKWKPSVSLSFTVYSHGSDPAKKITPRYEDETKAAAFKFSNADDYNSNMLTHCQEFDWTFPGYQDWFTEPKAINLDHKLSVYWSVSVGDSPHPTPKPSSHITIQQNRHGHTAWTLPISYPNGVDYDRPRLFNNDEKFGNFKVSGQSYSVHNYDDIGALLEYEPMRTHIGMDKIRICNIGPKNIYVKSIYGIVHGTVKSTPGGNAGMAGR